jgi:hypothetical protein
MKKLTILTLLFFLALAGASAFAGEKKEKPMSHAMKGYLVDKMCATGMAKKSPEEAMAKAAKHTKSCALEESCVESGFGLISEGKWYKFDDAGDKQALAWLKKTDKKNELMVEVTGTHDGDIFNVVSLKDVKATGVKKEMKHDEMKKEDTKKD